MSSREPATEPCNCPQSLELAGRVRELEEALRALVKADSRIWLCSTCGEPGNHAVACPWTLAMKALQPTPPAPSNGEGET